MIKATRPYQPGDTLPAVGNICFMSGSNCDITSDQDRDYLQVMVLAYTDDKQFGVFQKKGMWPFVERLTNCWFGEEEPPIKPGDVFVSKDSQKRFGEDSWLVSVYDDGTLGGEITKIAAFPKKKYAEDYMNSIPTPAIGLVERFRLPVGGMDDWCRKRCNCIDSPCIWSPEMRIHLCYPEKWKRFPKEDD